MPLYVDSKDNLVIVEEDYSYDKDKAEITALDYLILIIGARDKDYLIENNRNILDNHCTSLFPIYSYNMLSFILYLLTLHFPACYHLFDFKTDRIEGVSSKLFNKLIKQRQQKENKKFQVYDFASRPFAYLEFPKKGFIISPHYFNLPEKVVQKNKYTNLYIEKNIRVLTDFRTGGKFSNMIPLLSPFKLDVLFYLPRFYKQLYYQKHQYSLGKAIQKDWSNIDRQKEIIDMGFTPKQIKKINLKLKDFFEKLGLNSVKCLYNSVDRSDSLIYGIEELHEFYLKSILISRHPNLRLNTKKNRTNGVYLLHNGVGRFKELMFDEILGNEDMLDYKISIKEKFIHFKGKETRLFSINKTFDFNSKTLLDKKFLRIVNQVYKNLPLHRFVFLAHLYIHLFNQHGDDLVYLLLADRFKTEFNYQRFCERFEKSYTQKIAKGYFTFKNFETIFFSSEKKVNHAKKKPGIDRFRVLLYYLHHHNLFTAEYKDYLWDRYALNPSSSFVS